MDDVYFEELDHDDIERLEEANEAPVRPGEAEEEVVTSARDVKPKKIVIKPRLKLDDKRLKGPRGLCVLEPVFKDITLKGPGYERRDLETVMSVLEHWAHRLFPKLTFDDCLERIEELGHKKSVSSYVTLLRMGCGDAVGEETNEEVAPPRSPSPERVVDPFDALLDRPVQSQLTEEQKERMEMNKLLAIERRKARLKAKYEKENSLISSTDTNIDNTDSNIHNGDKNSSIRSDVYTTTNELTENISCHGNNNKYDQALTNIVVSETSSINLSDKCEETSPAQNSAEGFSEGNTHGIKVSGNVTEPMDENSTLIDHQNNLRDTSDDMDTFD